MKYKTSNGIEIEYEIIRKKNKNIYFRVKEDLKLYVSAPIYLSGKSVLTLIEQNEKAILKMYDKQASKLKKENTYQYLGKDYLIVIDDTSMEVTILDDKVITPSIEKLDEFTQKNIEKIYGEEIEFCQKCFAKLPDFTWKVRFMKTRWGVCNTRTKQITLNTELIKKDIDLLEYVIIHEMCHFFEGNHSKAFWALVGQAYPRYKEARKRLKE